jgi:hypothetical protein
MNDEIGMIANALPIQIACIHIGHFFIVLGNVQRFLNW